MKKTTTLKQTVYSKLLNSILNNEFDVNTVLNEKTLVERYNVSKSPIREALTELCNEGILRSIPRYGYEILKLTNLDVQEIQQYRLIIEIESLKKCFPTLTQQNIKSLRDLHDKCYKQSVNFDILEHWSINSNFHLLLISFSNSKYLYKNLEAALFTLARARIQLCFEKWSTTNYTDDASLHLKLIEAIEKGDKEASIKALTEDINMF